MHAYIGNNHDMTTIKKMPAALAPLSTSSPVKIAVVVGLCLLLVVIIYLTTRVVYYEWEHIKYYILCVWGGKHTAGLPTPSRMLGRVLAIIQHAVKIEPCLTLVDFGCGDGEFLYQIHQALPNMRLVGIELVSASAQRSRERFAHIKNIHIETSDMTVYRFQNRPTLLYLYEPLWTLSSGEALPVYRMVLGNLLADVQTQHAVYVLYVSGVHAHLSADFLDCFLPMRVIAHGKVPRFVGANHVWLLTTDVHR